MEGASVSNGWWDMWQAMEKLRMSDRSIRRLIREKKLEGRKAAGKWWIKATPFDPRLADLALDAAPSHAESVPITRSPQLELAAHSKPGPVTPFGKPELSRQSDAPPAQSPRPAGGDGHGDTRRGPRVQDSNEERQDGGRREERSLQVQREHVHIDLDLEPLESLIDVKRIGAWRKTCELHSMLQSVEYQQQTKAAAALLVEGYLAFSGRKVDAYLRCRATLCRLLIDLQFDGATEPLVKRCYDAIGAVQSLIIRFTKAKKPHDNDSRAEG